MQYEIYKINKDTHKREEILDRVISFYWSDDIDNLHTSFNFESYDELLKNRCLFQTRSLSSRVGEAIRLNVVLINMLFLLDCHVVYDSSQ